MIIKKKLILIDGGPASGKNTLGILLLQDFQKRGIKAILLDLDVNVEEINPSWIWKSKQEEGKDQQKARENYIRGINKYLQQDYIVIAIGERFLTKENIAIFINKLTVNCSIYLYHLSIPFPLRTRRLDERGPHSIIDLNKDQRERDSIKTWYGYVYENINSPIEDAKNMMRLIQNNEGLLVSTFFK